MPDRIARLVLPLAWLALASCDGPVTRRYGDGGADSGTCAPGAYLCSSLTSYKRCGNSGVPGADQRCPDGQICVGGEVACGICRPGVKDCDPSAPDTPRVCSADGSEWVPQAACDVNMGLICSGGVCADRCQVDGTSYLGCEYWPTVTPNSQLNPDFKFAVIVANPQTYSVRITIEGGALSAPITRTLDAGTVDTFQLPAVTALMQNRRECFSLTPPSVDQCIARSAHGTAATGSSAYHLVSNGPVAVYQFNPLEYRRPATGTPSAFSLSNDASLLLPHNVLADRNNWQYIVVGRENFRLSATTGMGAAVTLGGFVSIVSAAPEGQSVTLQLNLKARVRDPDSTTNTWAAGARTVTLARGEVLQLVGTDDGQDLTGSTITSNQPIAVFAGHDCTNVPNTRKACDHLEEQVLPMATWGSRVAVSLLRDRAGVPSRVRIVSQRQGNMLTFDGISAPAPCARTLGLAEFCEFDMTADFQVTGTQPLLVMQYMEGLGEDPRCVPSGGLFPDLPACAGDPAMATEVPIEQYRTTYDILIPPGYTANYVNLVLPTTASVFIDGAMVTSTPNPAGTGYVVRTAPITAGQHRITGSERFGVKVYGVAPYTSYMYPGGLDLAPINPPG